MIGKSWITEAAEDIASRWPAGSGPDSYVTDEQRANIIQNLSAIIISHSPFKLDTAYEEVRPSPLLQCIDCHNTESPAGAMAREFNHGRCLHCGGYFKVVRA